MYHIFCIHSSVEGHLGSFQLLAIINKAAMNILENESLLQVGTSSGYMIRNGIAGSSGSTMSSFLRRGNKIPMEGVSETKFRAETEGITIQRMPHLGIHPINNHQTETLLQMPTRAC